MLLRVWYELSRIDALSRFFEAVIFYWQKTFSSDGDKCLEELLSSYCQNWNTNCYISSLLVVVAHTEVAYVNLFEDSNRHQS